MKKYVLLCMLVMLVSGCRNFYQYQKDGEIFTAYQSKFTNKSVNVITECETARATTGFTADSPVPNVSFGWWWTALLETNLQPGGKLIFYKESHSMFTNTITGTTFLYVENNSKKIKNIQINSFPRYFMDMLFLRIGLGKNITTVKITDKLKNTKVKVGDKNGK